MVSRLVQQIQTEYYINISDVRAFETELLHAAAALPDGQTLANLLRCTVRQICRANSILADGTAVVEGDEQCWDLLADLSKHPAAMFAIIRRSPNMLCQLRGYPAAAATVNGKCKRDE